MKFIILMAFSFLLMGCDAQNYYYGTIAKLGFIAYRTPLDSVGAGTIIKGQPKNLMVYTKPDRCLPNTFPDGSPTNLRYVANTDLPQKLREVKLDFNIDLGFFGSNGNPIFKVNPNAKYVSKVSVKFTDAKIEFIDEIAFWDYFSKHMEESCKHALMQFPIFWKTLKVDKMEYVFHNEAGAAIKLSVPMLKEILDISADVNFSIVNDTTLSIQTPKYIGFLAVQLTPEAVAKEQAALYSNRVDAKENFIWESIKMKSAKPSVLPVRAPSLIH